MPETRLQSNAPGYSPQKPRPACASHPLTADERRLAQLYPTLLRRARRLAATQADAEDLAHDTIARALDHPQALQFGPKLFEWMCVVMRNLFIDGQRRRRIRRHVPIDGVALSARDDAPIERWRRLKSEDVTRAVERLDGPTRRLLEMRWQQRSSYREISEALGIPSRTVGTRLLRARRRIRVAVLAEHGELE